MAILKERLDLGLRSLCMGRRCSETASNAARPHEPRRGAVNCDSCRVIWVVRFLRRRVALMIPAKSMYVPVDGGRPLRRRWLLQGSILGGDQ